MRRCWAPDYTQIAAYLEQVVNRSCLDELAAKSSPASPPAHPCSHAPLHPCTLAPLRHRTRCSLSKHPLCNRILHPDLISQSLQLSVRARLGIIPCKPSPSFRFPFPLTCFACDKSSRKFPHSYSFRRVSAPIASCTSVTSSDLIFGCRCLLLSQRASTRQSHHDD